MNKANNIFLAQNFPAVSNGSSVKAGLGKSIVPKGKTRKDAVLLECELTGNVSNSGVFSVSGKTTIPVHSIRLGVAKQDFDATHPDLYNKIDKVISQMEILDRPDNKSSYQYEWKIDYKGSSSMPLSAVKVVAVHDIVNRKDVMHLYIFAIEHNTISSEIILR